MTKGENGVWTFTTAALPPGAYRYNFNVDGVTVTGCSTVSPTASATYPDHRAIEVPMATLDSSYEGEVGFIKIDVEGHEQAVLDGAVQTIRRCRPRLLVEIDER